MPILLHELNIKGNPPDIEHSGFSIEYESVNNLYKFSKANV
jgi:hypothetical protein